MTQKLYVVQNDLAPVPSATLLDQQGLPIDLYGMSVGFRLVNNATKAPVVDNKRATILQNGAVGKGQVIYYWQTGDTATPGLYRGFWIVSSVILTTQNQQTVTFTGGANSGTFTLYMVVNGVIQSTGPMAWNISFADLAANLATLSIIGSTSNVSVSGNVGQQYAITFTNELQNVFLPIFKTQNALFGTGNVVITCANTSQYVTSGQEKFPNGGDAYYILIQPSI